MQPRNLKRGGLAQIWAVALQERIREKEPHAERT
jgi:hypothetical protein